MANRRAYLPINHCLHDECAVKVETRQARRLNERNGEPHAAAAVDNCEVGGADARAWLVPCNGALAKARAFR